MTVCLIAPAYTSSMSEIQICGLTNSLPREERQRNSKKRILPLELDKRYEHGGASTGASSAGGKERKKDGSIWSQKVVWNSIHPPEELLTPALIKVIMVADL